MSENSNSDDNVKAQRILELLTTVLSLRWGTIWWPDEDLWKQCHSHHDVKSDRVEHPGLYLRRKVSFDTLFEPIPMAIGTTRGSNKGRDTLRVKGLRASEPERVTCFRLGRRGLFLLHHFAERRETPPYRMRVYLNMDKPHLDREEEKALALLLGRQGTHGQ